jgi:hypothetical protein
MKRCTNNGTRKATEIADGMRRFGNYAGMDDLYRRGCFRHLEDAAYARIALEKHGETVNSVASYLDSTYEGPRALKHRCDRVYPSS